MDLMSFNDLAGLIAMIVALGGVWWRVHQAINAVARELSAYKLDVAEKYASVEHLREVEARLVIPIDRLSDRIDRLLASLERGK